MRPSVLFTLSVLVLLVAPFAGQIALDWRALGVPRSVDAQILFDIRIPRVLLAFLVGGVLSLGGLLFQTLFRNELSTPFTLGTAGAATLFAAVSITLGLQNLTPLFAFGGALASVALLFALHTRFGRGDTATLLLTGVALSFFYAAALMLVYYLSDLQENYEIMRFSMGGLDIVGYDALPFLVAAAAVLLGVALAMRRTVRTLAASHEYALLNGIHVTRAAYIILGAVSLAVGAAVSLAGPIGFIGLIVPHLIRRIYRQSVDRLILPAFFYGGVFLVLCDTVARTSGMASDIPVGVVTAFIGAPFFVYMLLRRKR